MSLDDLNKELYNYNSKIVPTHSHESSEFDPNKAASDKASPFDEQESWNRPQKGLSQKKKTILLIAGAVLSVIILIIAGYFIYGWWQKSAFHQDRVSISFEGPKEVDSTRPVKFVIHYKNDNRASLKNAEIQLNYSENFQPTDNVNLKYLSPSSSKIFIGDIKSKSEGSVDLTGSFYAPKDTPVYLYASLNFVPSNAVDSVSVKNQIGVSTTAAPVLLELAAPRETVGGYDIEYVIDYKNLDTRRMSNMQIRIDFPQGFQISDAEPMPSEKDSYWYLGSLEPDQSGKITIKGQLQGDSGDQESIVVSLGTVGDDGNFVVFDKRENNTSVVLPILTINQSLDNKDSNIINPGETLAYTISYKNTGSIGLRDAIIYAQIKGKILDFSKINVIKGSYNEKTGIITWKGSDVESLKNIESQTTGTVHFSIPVKANIPVGDSLDKNFIVSSVAKIDSPDIPVPNGSEKIIGSNTLELKLASKVLFNVNGYYKDEKIENSGPIPMQVGSPTTFTIHWSVSNISNDISDAKVVSSLAAGLRWTGKIYPDNENITYNERTNQIIWDAGDVGVGTGVLTPPREVAFQIEVTPQANQVGKAIDLINESDFSAMDSFIGQSITLKGVKKSTELPEDPEVGYEKSKVEAKK